jgi:hypothetical protein
MRSSIASDRRLPTVSLPASKEPSLNVVEPFLQLGQQCRSSLETDAVDELGDAFEEAGLIWFFYAEAAASSAAKRG